jgi:hypothetical protein
MSLSEASIIIEENQSSNIVVRKRFFLSRTLLIALSSPLLVIASDISILYMVIKLHLEFQTVLASLIRYEWFNKDLIGPCQLSLRINNVKLETRDRNDVIQTNLVDVASVAAHSP